jgi:LAO/AO transport system kinase
VLLIAPGGGDELQGIKKGIVELADLVLINKADGNLLAAAQLTQIEYVSALKLLRPRSPYWLPKVLRISSATQEGLKESWKGMMEYYNVMLEKGEFFKKRALQRKTRMWRHVTDDVLLFLKNDSELQALVASLEQRVVAGDLSPSKAADKILNSLLNFRAVNSKTETK